MAIIPEDIRHRRQFNPTPVITIPRIEKITAPKFKQRLLSRFYVRLHMTLMLCAVILSGVSASKLLLELEVNWMFIRYPIAVCVAYGIFFLSIKVWLWYVGFGPRLNDDTDIDIEALSDLENELADFSSAETGSYDPNWSGSEAGSAAESWGDAPYGDGSTSSSSSSSSSEGSSFDSASGMISETKSSSCSRC